MTRNAPPLARIRSLGDSSREFAIWSDAWAIEPERSGTATCYVLSLIGPPLAVRGLHSAFLSHVPLELREPSGTRKTFTARWETACRARWSRLPSGALHALLVADLRRQPPPASRLVLAPSEAVLAEAVFTDLFRYSGLMALPEWRAWLLSTLLERELAVRLEGTLPALLVSASEEQLDDLTQAGLRARAIWFPAEDETA